MRRPTATSFNRRTYAELGRLARAELERGGGVIVDATFRNRADRAAFFEALGGLPEAAVAVECRAPLAVRLDRARRRFDTGASSDADAGVVRRQEDDGELAEDVPPGQHVVLRTDRPAEAALDDLAALLDARLGRPRPVVDRNGTRAHADGRSGLRP